MAQDRPPIDPDRLERAARMLSAIEREALVLSAAERLSNDEIAGRLGLPHEAVEQLLSHALCKLDRALEREERPWWRLW